MYAWNSGSPRKILEDLPADLECLENRVIAQVPSTVCDTYVNPLPQHWHGLLPSPVSEAVCIADAVPLHVTTPD